jgi:glutamyl-tRNA reductase
VSEILIANRTRERSQSLADEFNGQVIDYSSLLDALPEVDILLASSGATHYILTRDQMRAVISRRKNRPMFLIDIAVPRNIEPDVNKLDNVFLYDIDDLDKTVQSNIEGRNATAIEAEEIIREEVERMMQRLKTREVAPTIISLQEQLEVVRKGEIARMRARLGPMTPQQEQAIEAITRGIINKIAHGPITELRRTASHPEHAHLSDLIRRLFRLEHK